MTTIQYVYPRLYLERYNHTICLPRLYLERYNHTICLPRLYLERYRAVVLGDRRGRHRMVVGFTTTYATSPYHH